MFRNLRPGAVRVGFATAVIFAVLTSDALAQCDSGHPGQSVDSCGSCDGISPRVVCEGNTQVRGDVSSEMHSVQSFTQKPLTWTVHSELFRFAVVTEAACAPVAEGTLIARREEGERPVWRRVLVNNPAAVFVDDRGRWVVTIGNACSSSNSHAITVYGASGETLRDLDLDEVLLADELPRVRTEPESGSRGLFRVGGRIGFDDAGVSLVLPWGRRVRIL